MWIAITLVAAIVVSLFLLGASAAREIDRGKKEREDFHGRVYRSREE